MSFLSSGQETGCSSTPTPMLVAELLLRLPREVGVALCQVPGLDDTEMPERHHADMFDVIASFLTEEELDEAHSLRLELEDERDCKEAQALEEKEELERKWGELITLTLKN